MIIINKMTNKRLNRELDAICIDIADFIDRFCKEKNLSVEEICMKSKIHNEKLLSGKFSLTQFLRICYNLDISPSKVLEELYDRRTVELR